MLEAIKFFIDSTWMLLSIEIPVSESIRFTPWQFSLYIIIAVVILKQIFGQGGK